MSLSRSPRRLAIVANAYPDDDDPYQAAFLTTRAEWYARAGVEVRVVVPGDHKEYRHHGIPVTKVAPLEMADAVNAFRPQVAAVHSPNWRMRRALAALECPVVYWLHGSEALWVRDFPRPRGWLALQYKRLKLWPRLLRQMAFLRRLVQESRFPVVTVSQWMANSLRRALRLPRLGVRVIPNPIDTELFAFRQASAPISDSAVIFRNLSNRIYGFADAIKAFQPGLTAPPGRLTVIGEGTELDRYVRLAKRLGAVVDFEARTVPHAELPVVLERFGILLNPTYRETHGVTMCEAMAMGIPVVGYRVGAVPEYVVDGVSGILVTQGDIEGLRHGITRLLVDREFYVAASVAGAEHVRVVCGAPHIVPQELELLWDASGRP